MDKETPLFPRVKRTKAKPSMQHKRENKIIKRDPSRRYMVIPKLNAEEYANALATQVALKAKREELQSLLPETIAYTTIQIRSL
jgi:hypothetical protein